MRDDFDRLRGRERRARHPLDAEQARSPQPVVDAPGQQRRVLVAGFHREHGQAGVGEQALVAGPGECRADARQHRKGTSEVGAEARVLDDHVAERQAASGPQHPP